MLAGRRIAPKPVRLEAVDGRSSRSPPTSSTTVHGEGADRSALDLPLVLMILDRCEGAAAVGLLERAVGFGSQRSVGVGDVPPQPIGLDAERGALPAFPAASVDRHAAERAHEVVGQLMPEAGDAVARRVIELASAVAPLRCV
jgi:hypothetical protein